VRARAAAAGLALAAAALACAGAPGRVAPVPAGALEDLAAPRALPGPGAGPWAEVGPPPPPEPAAPRPAPDAAVEPPALAALRARVVGAAAAREGRPFRGD
jgi:hypothetical protein